MRAIRFYCIIAILILVPLIGILTLSRVMEDDVEATITQLAMTDTDGGMCYGIQLPSGKLIMIDSGYEQDAAPIAQYIRAHGGVVAAWFITHPHFDHVGGFIPVVGNNMDGIEVEQVYYSDFTEEFFTEPEEGKNLEMLNKALLLDEFNDIKESSDTQFTPVVRDDKIKLEGVTITCMNAFNPALYDVNGNSLALHIDFGKTTFMVTGEITEQSLAYMMEAYGEKNKLWDVDYIQIPHHGYMAGIGLEGLQQLYQLTTPSYAFVDCSFNEYVTDAVQIQTHLMVLHEMNIPLILRFEGNHVISL